LGEKALRSKNTKNGKVKEENCVINGKKNKLKMLISGI